MQIRLTRYPNNETRIAVYPPRRAGLNAVDGTQTEPIPSIAHESSTNTPLSNLPPSSIAGDARSLDIKFKVERGERKRRVELSRYGRRRILRAGSCFSQDEGSVRLLLTGTLPGSTRESLRALAGYSSYVTHRLCAWLTYRQRSAKWMYTWEYQKRGALHLHLVVELSEENAQYVEEHFKDEWNRLLNRIGSMSGVDMFRKTATYRHTQDKTQADTLRCDREPARYISKYISKQNTKAFGVNRFPPKQWYQISRSLLRELEERTEVYEQTGVSYRQARAFIEDAVHNIESAVLGGSREFRGVVFAWSGYCYDSHFQIEEWGKKFMNIRENLLSTDVVCKMVAGTMANYPNLRCYMRGKGYSEVIDKVRMGTATQTEMLWYIDRVMDVATLGISVVLKKNTLARMLLTIDSWWERKHGYGRLTGEFKQELNKLCED